MQVDNKLLDDLARVAAGAAGAVSGLREEVEAQMRQRMERLLANMDVVTREEFEVVRELAANARREQEALAKTVAALEQRIAALEGGAPKVLAKSGAKTGTKTGAKTGAKSETKPRAAAKQPAAAKSRKPARKAATAKKDETPD